MLDATATPECEPIAHDPVLSTRQEAFCRHFTASGNAADAARRAGYAERSARQTGHALLERPYIVERVRRIRMSWQRTARDEARIALARLEQAWDAAVASGSAYLMLQIVRLQAEIAGLARPAGMRRAVLWPVAGEDEFGEMAAGGAPEAGTEPGPLADAVRRGRDRAERVFARHCASREALERQEDFDESGYAQTAERLADAIEERERLPVSFEPPAPPPAEDRPQADDPPEETYEEDGWVGDERPSDDDRVDGAENDWLYQRREGLEPYDPWLPENVALRVRDRLAWQERVHDNDPFAPDEPEGPEGSDDGEFAPGHDAS